jgi:tyrosine-protein kinase Etk/Wzc
MQVTQKKGLEVDKSQMINFNQLWSRYIVYWPFYLVLLLVFLVGTWLYIRYYTTPLYATNARILIKDQRKGIEDSKSIEDLNLITIKKIIENEMEVIKSRTLIRDVVKTLHLYAPVFKEGRINSLSAYTSSPIRIEVIDPDSFKESGKIPFRYDDKISRVIINKNIYPLNTWVYTPYGNLRFMPNKYYDGKQQGNFYFYLINPESITFGIQSRLTVAAASKLSTILDIDYRDEVPERGADIINELMITYNKALVNDKNSLARNTLVFVEERLRHVAHDLDSIEHRVQNFKANQGAIDISTQGQLYLRNVSENDQKLSKVNEQIAVLDKVEDYALSNNATGGVVPSTLGIEDEQLSKLLNNLSKSEQEYERLKNTTAENSPIIISLRNQIESTRPAILENIKSQRSSLQASKANLASTNSSYSSLLQSFPQKERELIDINREQIIKNDIYTFLLKKREETALSFASTVSDTRVVDNAISSSAPVSPNLRIIYLAAILGSLFLGIAIVTARETFNNKVLFRHEIESLTSHPIIGEIVYEKSNDPVVIGEGKKTFIAEQFRKLRISLKYMGINSKKKRVLITSTIEGEGKSFITTNLGLSLALTGKKVILLELDLNAPSLSRKLNVNAVSGMSDYLLGTKEPEEIINKTAYDNLFIISAGPLPKNPAELLMNGKIQDLLSYLDEIFDYVLIDTAPVSPVTDAYILSAYCDTTLYIVRHEYTPKVFIQRLDENNKINQLKNIAIVFNGVHSRGFFKSNYGYGYGYGYMYNEKKGSTYSRPQAGI